MEKDTTYDVYIFPCMLYIRHERGFVLVEIIVGLGVFLLFSVGIYSSIQLVFKVVYQSRVRAVEAQILNEQIELIRNLPYDSVGIVSSTPPGILERSVQVTRNNIPFTVVRTIRSVDDPFDGTIGGTPNDASPADYKFLEISVICDSCTQEVAQSMTTQIAPKGVEGSSASGALFVSVFDANARPVEGATVRIVATSTNPAIDMTDVTDSAGFLREVALPTGTSTYAIFVSKAGYTAEGTRMPTIANPHPLKEPASVFAGEITQANFTIDRVSQVSIDTVDSLCVPIPSVPLLFTGTRLIGTNPNVLLVEASVLTDGSGQYVSSSVPWDAYSVEPAGYDLLGMIPAQPISLLPAADQPVVAVLGPATEHSLLIHVRDRATLQPISSATVTVTSSEYSETKTTGIGHIRQTDWSGGNGQEMMEDALRYWADNSSVEIANPAGDLALLKIADDYAADGVLESSIFDVGTPANFVNLVWEPLLQPEPAGAHPLKFQIARSNSSTEGVWNYQGPDGTADTFYDEEHTAVNPAPGASRFVRYKAFLHTDTSTTTPILSDVSLTYTTSCTPPGQAYVGNLSEDTYTLTVTADGYQTVAETIPVSGSGNVVIDMTTL